MTRLLLLTAMLLSLFTTPTWAVTVVTGSYTGNDTDNTNIVTSPACQPVMVFIKRRDSAWGPQIWISPMGTNNSRHWVGTAGGADLIQQANSDGFQIGINGGTTGYINAAGSPYDYITLCDNGANDIAVGTWTGDASDNRDITISPAFPPELVIVARNDTGVRTWRGASSHSGDQASDSAASADLADYIQSFSSNGFQVGASNNNNTVVFYYVALKGSALGVITGTFAGNTSDDRDITAPGIQPLFTLIKSSGAVNSAYRFTTNSALNSYGGTAAEATNIIQSFLSTGFQVGTDSQANHNGNTMRWFVLKTVLASGRHSAPILFP